MIDDIIPEPIGGAHRDPTWMANRLKSYLRGALRELMAKPLQELVDARYRKFRRMGMFHEGRGRCTGGRRRRFRLPPFRRRTASTTPPYRPILDHEPTALSYWFKKQSLTLLQIRLPFHFGEKNERPLRTPTRPLRNPLAKAVRLKSSSISFLSPSSASWHGEFRIRKEPAENF